MPSKSVKPNIDKKIDQELPRLFRAAANLRRYGLSRSEVIAVVRDGMDSAE